MKVESDDFDDVDAIPVSLVPKVCKNLTLVNADFSLFKSPSGIVSVP